MKRPKYHPKIPFFLPPYGLHGWTGSLFGNVKLPVLSGRPRVLYGRTWVDTLWLEVIEIWGVKNGGGGRIWIKQLKFFWLNLLWYCSEFHKVFCKIINNCPSTVNKLYSLHVFVSSFIIAFWVKSTHLLWYVEYSTHGCLVGCKVPDLWIIQEYQGAPPCDPPWEYYI